MFEHLPLQLDIAIAQNLVPNWKDIVRNDYHVSIFKESGKPNTLIFAPQYCTIGVLNDCLQDAVEMGQEFVLNKTCKSFSVRFMFEPNGGWPHVLLTWKRYDE
jgi:hypothetical protein